MALEGGVNSIIKTNSNYKSSKHNRNDKHNKKMKLKKYWKIYVVQKTQLLLHMSQPTKKPLLFSLKSFRRWSTFLQKLLQMIINEMQ